MIIVPQLRIGYQNVPKIATTSLFNWMYKCCDPRAQPGGKPLPRPRRYFLAQYGDNVLVDNTADAIAPYRDYLRFALTRDPVKRFISMYANRVLFHLDLSESSRNARELREAGLPFDPQINDLVARLEEYAAAVTVIHHHARPMMDFLGPDLAVYDRLVDIGEIDGTVEAIRAHWRTQGLEALGAKSPRVQRLQRQGPKLGLEVLGEAAFEKLMDYYRVDYANVPTVSESAIRAEYRLALASGPAQHPAPRVRRSPNAAREKLRIEAQPHAELARLRVRAMPAAGGATGCVDIVGTAVLKERLEAGEWRLVIADGARRHAVEWSLPTPNLARHFPRSPNAAHARFRAAAVMLEPGHSLQLQLERAGGAPRLVATIARG